MAQINLGRIAFVNKGDWADGLHKVNDVVKYNNGIYACIKEHTSNNGDILPTDTTYWVNWIDENKWYLRTTLDKVNILRADKYLAAQDIASMIYDNSNNLVKIQYNQASDTNYEVLNYDSNGNLSTIDHYIDTVLKGTTTLTYDSNNTLISSVYSSAQ